MVEMRIGSKKFTILNRAITSDDPDLAEFLNKAAEYAFKQPKHQDDPDLLLADYLAFALGAEITDYKMPEELRRLVTSGAIL